MHKTIEWIQGLRAVAVLAVIIYHLNHALLSGGFLGVDLFFVISGFLITRKLMREADETGTIDALKFWGDRAKRLLPNALLVLLAVLVATAILLPPYRFTSVSADVVRAAIFLSNYNFAAQATDYFHFNDVPSPILHFWSLSIEEQYYFALPILLLALSWIFSKQRTRAICIFLVLTLIVSLAINLIESHSSPQAAFFHTQTRIWQLSLGGLLGINFERVANVPSVARSFLAYIGALVLVTCAVVYNNDIGYPGYWAIIPTLASALILAGTPSTKHLAKWLSIKPMTAIGDRSYSLYLWHWPVLALAAEAWPDSVVAGAVAIPVFVGSACIAYAGIERPIHESKSFPAGRVPIGAAAIGAICAASYLLTAIPTPPALAERVEAIKRASNDFGKNIADNCHLQVDDVTQPPCIYGAHTSSRILFLFGDSHAAMWFSPVAKAADKLGWKVVVRTRSGCPAAFVSIWIPWLKAYYKNCDSWRTAVIDEIRNVRPALIIVSEFGNYYNWLYDRTAQAILNPSNSRAAWNKGVSDLIAALPSTSHVIVLRDTPTQLKSYKNCLSYTDNCGRERNSALSQMPPIDPSRIGGNVQMVDLTDRICDESWCPAIKDGTIIYQDDHHLTATFTETLAPEFTKQLLGIKLQISTGARPPDTADIR